MYTRQVFHRLKLIMIQINDQLFLFSFLQLLCFVCMCFASALAKPITRCLVWQEACRCFEFAHHFEYHLAWQHTHFYMHM